MADADRICRFNYSDHLVKAIALAEAAGIRLAAADPDRRGAAVADARRLTARLSARLDASPLTGETADGVDAGVHRPVPAVGATSGAVEGGWAQTLKLDGMGTQDVAAVEYANLLACFDAEPALAERLFEAPLETLADVHSLVGRGLVDPQDAGQPRRTEQAVHDGAQGQVIYRVPRPDRVPALLAALGEWLGDASAARPAVVVAGVVQERLLEWQPFEVANGRVARVVSRLVLRARGIDPHGAGVAEVLQARDPRAYYGEVAATIRRRGDLSGWLERYAEAVVDGLEAAVAQVQPGPRPPAPTRAGAICGRLDVGETITLIEYADRAKVRRETAGRDLDALVRSGVLAREPGTHGLRFRRLDPRPRSGGRRDATLRTQMRPDTTRSGE